MYLTGGQFKGFKIEVPKDVKPTLSKVRESVFNILQPYYFENSKFLDMFAGSAIMGLEALSRGYKVKEIEINPKNLKIIKENYKKTNIEADITLANALKYKSNEKYNVIYIDPPWSFNYAPIIKKATELLDKNGIIIIEYDTTQDIDIDKIIKKEDFQIKIIKSKKYGRVLVEVLSFIN